MPEQNATPIPTQLNIAPRGKSWKDWRLVDGTDGFPTREAMEKYHCHPERVQALEDERLALLESTRQLNQLNDRQAAQIKELEAQLEAICAGGVEPLRKPVQAVDALKPLGWAAEINGAHFRQFGDWLPDEDCYDSGTLVKLFALPVSEQEAQAARDALAAAQAKQGAE